MPLPEHTIIPFPSLAPSRSTVFSNSSPSDEKQVLRVAGIIPTMEELEHFWHTGEVLRLSGEQTNYYDKIVFSVPRVGRRGLLEGLQEKMLDRRSKVTISSITDRGKYQSLTAASRSLDGENIARATVTKEGVSSMTFWINPAPDVEPPNKKIISLAEYRRTRRQRVSNLPPVLA